MDFLDLDLPAVEIALFASRFGSVRTAARVLQLEEVAALRRLELLEEQLGVSLLEGASPPRRCTIAHRWRDHR